MKKEQKVALKTMAIKAKVYNFIRKRLYKVVDMSDNLKIEFYKEVFDLNAKAHRELNEYKQKRRDKAKRDKIREDNGYIPKKKTTKLDWEKHKESFKLINDTLPAGSFYIPMSENQTIITKDIAEQGKLEQDKLEQENIVPGRTYKFPFTVESDHSTIEGESSDEKKKDLTLR